jgi:hypothetical protein
VTPERVCISELGADAPADHAYPGHVDLEPVEGGARLCVHRFEPGRCDRGANHLSGEPLQEFKDAFAGTEPYFYMLWFFVADEDQVEFDAWYQHEHAPRLLGLSSWRRITLFGNVHWGGAASEPARFSIHRLADTTAVGTAEHERARDTNWRRSLSSRPWYQQTRRGTYRVVDADALRWQP